VKARTVRASGGVEPTVAWMYSDLRPSLWAKALTRSSVRLSRVTSALGDQAGNRVAGGLAGAEWILVGVDHDGVGGVRALGSGCCREHGLVHDAEGGGGRCGGG